MLTLQEFQNSKNLVSMNKSKCPACGSSHTLKNGIRRGVQLFKCGDCGYQFRNSRLPPSKKIWELYLYNKQTVPELSEMFGVSESTIRRRLGEISVVWEQPPLSGSGFVHLDATYWGHNWGVMLALDECTGKPLYVAFIKHETNDDYIAAVRSIEERGYKIQGLILDGKQSLFRIFSEYKIQMCQFHMRQIVRRYLTRNPRLKASRALSEIMAGLTSSTKIGFEEAYLEWQRTYHSTIYRRTKLKDGKTKYTHQRLLTATRSIDFYLPYLFTYLEPECRGMPNTNNKIEGTFTDLKKNLNAHSGLSVENRKRFICGFFLAWK